MNRAARGFTLIEVLLAVGLLAVAMTLTVAAIRTLTRSSSRAEITAQHEEHLRAVQGYLRAQVSGALPISFNLDPEGSSESRVMIGQPLILDAKVPPGQHLA